MSLHRADRRFGELIRMVVWRAGLAPSAAVAASTLGPAFRILVASWLARRSTRRVGVAAIAGSVTAAMAARMLRDTIGRPRPGARSDGGFPSRHAAAAAAIVMAARDGAPFSPVVAAAAVAGLTGRVVTGDHDPADILAGIAIGSAIGLAIEGSLRRWPR